MSRPLLLPLLCLLPLLPGCIDFVEVAGPTEGGRAAMMLLMVRSESGEAGSSLEINGQLEPGTDSRSLPRTLASDTLWVMERALVPQWIEPHDMTRLYRERRDQSLDDSVVVRLPRVHGVSGELPRIRWHPPRRLDPDTIVLAEGRDLMLRLRADEAASDPPAARIHWSVLLRSRGHFSRIERTGALPTTLLLPWPLLPASEEGEIEVTLSVLEDHAYEAPARDYLLRATFSVQLDWKVRIVPAAGG